MNFEAIVKATLDTTQAQSQLNAFISQVQNTQVQIPVNANAMGKQGSDAGKAFSKQFTTSLNSIRIDTFDKQMTAWTRSNSKAIGKMMDSTTSTYGQQLTDYYLFYLIFIFFQLSIFNFISSSIIFVAIFQS